MPKLFVYNKYSDILRDTLGFSEAFHPILQTVDEYKDVSEGSHEQDSEVQEEGTT